MSRTLWAALVMAGMPGQAAEGQLVEGAIALTRFGLRYEAIAEFTIQEGTGFVPLRVAAGKTLTLRRVTATCTLSSTRMNFWTVRSSPETPVHHYLPIRAAVPKDGAVWISSEAVRIPVGAGGRPVATFQRSYNYGAVSDACVGSWAGYLEDAPR